MGGGGLAGGWLNRFFGATTIQRDANVGHLQIFNAVSKRSDVEEQENRN